MNRPRDNESSYEQRDLGDAMCLALAGDIDLDNASLLRAHLQTAAQTRETIIVDLTGLRYLDSSGVNVLLDGQRKLALGGRMIVLAAPSPTIRKILSLLHLEELIPVFSSVEEALTYLRAAGHSEEFALVGS